MERLEIEELNKLMFKKKNKKEYFFRDKKLNIFSIEKLMCNYFLVRINGVRMPYNMTFDKAITSFKCIFNE